VDFSGGFAAAKVVAQVSKPAVSRVSKLADASRGAVPSVFPHPADLSVSVSLRRDRAEAKGEGGEVGDTAGLETCATGGLIDFVNGPGLALILA